MYNTRFKPSSPIHSLKSTSNSFSRLGNLQILNTLSKDTSSKTKLGQDVVTQKLFAIKFLKSSFVDTMSTSLDNEASIQSVLSQEDHPNILKVVKYVQNADYTKKDGTVKKVNALITEFAEEGDLFEYLNKYGPLCEETTRTYFHDLINALEFIHGKGLAHMSLKLENLWLTNKFSLKINNFSCAYFASSEGDLPNQLHLSKSLNYTSPELVSNQSGNGFHNDLFACGVILFTMVTGYPPFNKASLDDIYYKLIIKQQFATFWKQHERRGLSLSPALKELLNNMLAFEPSQRLSISELKSNSWYLGEKKSYTEIKEEHDNKKDSLNLSSSRIYFEQQANRAKTSQNMTRNTTTQVPNGFYAFKGIKISKF